MPDRQKASSEATANHFARALGSSPWDTSNAGELLVHQEVCSSFMEASLGAGRRTTGDQCPLGNRFGKDGRDSLAGG